MLNLIDTKRTNRSKDPEAKLSKILVQFLANMSFHDIAKNCAKEHIFLYLMTSRIMQ